MNRLSTNRQSSIDERQWFIVQRWHEYDAEVRANLVRVAAVLAFYAIHLYNFAVLKGVERGYHRTVTLVSIGWAIVGLSALVAVGSKYLPWWLKYMTTALDLTLITILLVSGVGPQSPLIVAYFVIIVLASLRLQLPLIYFATLGASLSYLLVLALCHSEWWGNAERNFRVPRNEELMMLLAMCTTGAILGQAARRTRMLAVEYASRLIAQDESGAKP